MTLDQRSFECCILDGSISRKVPLLRKYLFYMCQINIKITEHSQIKRSKHVEQAVGLTFPFLKENNKNYDLTVSRSSLMLFVFNDSIFLCHFWVNSLNDHWNKKKDI